MPDTSKLGKLNRELEKSEKKLRKAINDEKALQHQLKQLTRKERTHRLCTRGGMLESFLQEPERLTDDDVMLLLKLIFHRQDTQDILKKLLEQKCLLRAQLYTTQRLVVSSGWIFRSHGLPNQGNTLPLRWLPPATLLWTCHLGTPCVASCSQPISFIKYNANGKLT